MLKLFKSKNPMIRLLIPIFAILFVYNLSDELIRSLILENNAFLYKNLLRVISGNFFALFYKILLVIFLTINSIYFSHILLFFKLYRKRSFIHAFFLLFLLSITIKIIDILPILIAMFLFLIVLKILMNTLRKKTAIYDHFNVGILMTVASFFWFDAIYFSFIIFVSLFVLRTINWREWFVPVMGIFITYFLMISIYFVSFSNFDIIYDIFNLVSQTATIPFVGINTIITISYVGFISLIASLLIISRYRTFETTTQNYYRIFFVLFLITVLIIIIPGFKFSAITFIPISLTIPLSRYFISRKRRIFKEVVFDLFLIAVIFNQLNLTF